MQDQLAPIPFIAFPKTALAGSGAPSIICARRVKCRFAGVVFWCSKKVESLITSWQIKLGGATWHESGVNGADHCFLVVEVDDFVLGFTNCASTARVTRTIV